jgi:hypothetical protein
VRHATDEGDAFGPSAEKLQYRIRFQADAWPRLVVEGPLQGADVKVHAHHPIIDEPARRRELMRRVDTGEDVFPFTRDEIADRAPSPLLDAVARSRWRYSRLASA